MMLTLSVAWNFTNQSILIKKSLTEIVAEKMNHLVLLETPETTGEVQDIPETTAGANPPL